MARYAKIDRRTLNDAKYMNLSDDAQHIWLEILIHPSMTGFGAMRMTVSGLASEKGWPLDRYEAAFAELETSGMVKHDRSASFMWLPNFLKYNAPESPNVVNSWKKLLDLLPECAMREDMLAKIKELIGKMSASFITAFQTVIEHVTVQVYRTRPALLEKKPQSPSPKSGAPSPRSGAIKDRQPEGLDDDFVAVRNAYNKIKPEGMLTGYDEYKELKRSGIWPGKDAVLSSIAKWSSTPKWTRGYAPGLKRFLAERQFMSIPEGRIEESHYPLFHPETPMSDEKRQEAEKVMRDVLTKLKEKNILGGLAHEGMQTAGSC